MLRDHTRLGSSRTSRGPVRSSGLEIAIPGTKNSWCSLQYRQCHLRCTNRVLQTGPGGSCQCTRHSNMRGHEWRCTLIPHCAPHSPVVCVCGGGGGGLRVCRRTTCIHPHPLLFQKQENRNTDTSDPEFWYIQSLHGVRNCMTSLPCTACTRGLSLTSGVSTRNGTQARTWSVGYTCGL